MPWVSRTPGREANYTCQGQTPVEKPVVEKPICQDLAALGLNFIPGFDHIV